MSVTADKIIREIDNALRAAQELRMEPLVTNYITQETTPSLSADSLSRACMVLASTIQKYAPPRAPHLTQMEALLSKFGPSNDYARKQLIGVVEALRHEYATGALSNVGELIHADLFTDFLDMARHLSEQGYKDPSAVVAAGVLEQHLRQLANKFGVSLTKPNGSYTTAESINEQLTKAGAYATGVQKEVTAMLEMRNNAAHAHWDKLDRGQVKVFIDRVSLFMTQHPA